MFQSIPVFISSGSVFNNMHILIHSDMTTAYGFDFKLHRPNGIIFYTNGYQCMEYNVVYQWMVNNFYFCLNFYKFFYILHFLFFSNAESCSELIFIQ